MSHSGGAGGEVEPHDISPGKEGRGKNRQKRHAQLMDAPLRPTPFLPQLLKRLCVVSQIKHRAAINE